MSDGGSLRGWMESRENISERYSARVFNVAGEDFESRMAASPDREFVELFSVEEAVRLRLEGLDFAV